MLHLVRTVAAWLARQLLPARRSHPQRPVTVGPSSSPVSTQARRPLRSHAPTPHGWTDGGPLLRPYVLSTEEWTRRRREGWPRAVSRSS